METGNEISSSSLSSCITTNGNLSQASDSSWNLENLTLSKLSASLEKLVIDRAEYDYSDAEIVFDDNKRIGVHRCVLASRSLFFQELFKKGNEGGREEKPRYLMSDLVPYGRVGYEAFDDFLCYLYTAKLKPPPVHVSTCVDEDCSHVACRPAICYCVELMYASATFQMKELVLLFQRRLLNFVEKAFVEDVIPILMVAFHCQLSQLLCSCVQRIARSDLERSCLEKELPPEVYSDVKELRAKWMEESEGNVVEEVESVREKRIRNIHKALDCDDIELLNLLLKESNVTLNDACALHYAVAYCDPKVVKELLSMDLIDLNLRNRRGYTVLHIAARRKEPSTLVKLLHKGASACETTSDGQTAVAICRRMTRPKDYNENIEKGKESNKDKMCIDVLEREMRRSLMSGSMSNMSTMVPADDLYMKNDYLESRVTFAKLLFPAEAKLAMDIADADSADNVSKVARKRGSSGYIKEVDLNENPAEEARRITQRLEVLRKTVMTGRRFFPHCSEVIDKFLEEDMPDALLLENGTPEEQKMKKIRFMELKDEVQKAFSKDMAENNRTGFPSSSSSSSSPKEAIKGKIRRR